jgi:hypothetical protein
MILYIWLGLSLVTCLVVMAAAALGSDSNFGEN